MIVGLPLLRCNGYCCVLWPWDCQSGNTNIYFQSLLFGDLLLVNKSSSDEPQEKYGTSLPWHASLGGCEIFGGSYRESFRRLPRKQVHRTHPGGRIAACAASTETSIFHRFYGSFHGSSLPWKLPWKFASMESSTEVGGSFHLNFHGSFHGRFSPLPWEPTVAFMEASMHRWKMVDVLQSV